MSLDDLVSLEEGARMYVEHLRRHKEKSPPITEFYLRFDTETQQLLSWKENKKGKLSRHYVKFGRLRRNNKILEDKAFLDYVLEHIPQEQRKELEALTAKYLQEFTLEQGVECYIRHLKKHKEKSTPITYFYLRFDPETQQLLSWKEKKKGKLNRHYARFSELRRNNKIPEDKAFLDYILEHIPQNQRKKLETLTAKYLNKFTLEQGVEFYIEHLKKHKEKSKSIIAFYNRFDPETQELIPSKEAKTGKLNRHYSKFIKLRRNNKIPSGLSLEDYLIQNLPEEKREETAYYLKGQYLIDLLDGNMLKQAVLGEEHVA